MLAEKLKLEKDQNTQLRHQLAQLVQLEKDQELQMQQRNSTIETLQVSWCSSVNISFNLPVRTVMYANIRMQIFLFRICIISAPFSWS